MGCEGVGGKGVFGDIGRMQMNRINRAHLMLSEECSIGRVESQLQGDVKVTLRVNNSCDPLVRGGGDKVEVDLNVGRIVEEGGGDQIVAVGAVVVGYVLG